MLFMKLKNEGKSGNISGLVEIPYKGDRKKNILSIALVRLTFVRLTLTTMNSTVLMRKN